MKQLILLAVFLCSFSLLFGQNSNPTPFATFGQLLNLSNTHPSATNDSSGPATIYLTTGKYAARTNLPVVNPVFGTGTVVIVMSVLKAQITATTVNAVVTTTPQESLDGVNWANVPSVTVSTLTPTSATVAVTTAWEFPYNYAPYKRLKNVVTVDTASIKGWYYLNNNTSNLK